MDLMVVKNWFSVVCCSLAYGFSHQWFPVWNFPESGSCPDWLSVECVGTKGMRDFVINPNIRALFQCTLHACVLRACGAQVSLTQLPNHEFRGTHTHVFQPSDTHACLDGSADSLPFFSTRRPSPNSIHHHSAGFDRWSEVDLSHPCRSLAMRWGTARMILQKVAKLFASVLSPRFLISIQSKVNSKPGSLFFVPFLFFCLQVYCILPFFLLPPSVGF